MNPTKIEWADMVWNPTTGCEKLSEGCKNCYALRMIPRLQAMKLNKYENGAEPTCHEEELCKPWKVKKHKIVFVNSMSDLFHSDIPRDFIQNVLHTIRNNPQHDFIILTKRAHRLQKFNFSNIKNLWLGVSVENDDVRPRIKILQQVDVAHRVISFEPLLGEIKRLSLKGIDWVFLGGETGPGARPMQPEWAEKIYHSCLKYDVPFFFKQSGAWMDKKADDPEFHDRYMRFIEPVAFTCEYPRILELRKEGVL